MNVLAGLDLLKQNEFKDIKGKKVGLICNMTSVFKDGGYAKDILHNCKNLKLLRLFGPEHGIYQTAQDMIGVNSNLDINTGLEIVSLYGNDLDSLKPDENNFKDLNCLIFDIQDIGSRYYTYIWTMLLAMKEAANNGLELIVLDRPNPIGGNVLEGGFIKEGFESFVGLHNITIRHSMTAGEIALMTQKELSLNIEIKILKVQNWKRNMWFDQTNLLWVPPSPNMPTLNTAIVYPGMCLLEGTNLSEGRGTTTPFEIFGAPFINPYELLEEVNKLNNPGCIFRPVFFEPTFQKWKGEVCGGFFIHVTDRNTFKSVTTAANIIDRINYLYPDNFKWREKAYEFVKDIPAIDLLTGSDLFRKYVNNGKDLKELFNKWEVEAEKFNDRRTEYLIYS